MSTARHHAEWLSLVEVSGPFLSMNELLRVFPQGLDRVETEKYQILRGYYDEWLAQRDSVAVHTAWIDAVLSEILEFEPSELLRGQQIPGDLKATVPEHGVTLRPEYALVSPDDKRTRLLIETYSPQQSLEAVVKGDRWASNPVDRMIALLRGTNVRLGLVTNGESWALVAAPPGGTSTIVTWYADLWLQERITLQAFVSLLGLARFFGVPDDRTLDAMLEASAADQQEVTDQLGKQVRSSVEILVQTFDRIDADSGRTLLTDVPDEKIYEAALTVMMRLVFLLCAEERGLLLTGNETYDQYYATTTLYAQLQEIADQHGEEILERRTDAWARLLALSRAVFAGVQHPDVMLPAYGGSLFDPDRFPFLEGRDEGTRWQTAEANPLPVDNRTVLHLLGSLQFLQVRAGTLTERRRLSFRALDIEQIGHVYEGLLDHRAARADEVVVGLTGSSEPEVGLSDLEDNEADGEAALIAYLRDQTGRTANALRNRLNAELEPADEAKLSRACGGDHALLDRVRPFAGLIRSDDYGVPVVIRPGALYVTAGTDRRSTGTHYTPRSLTEPIIQRTLEPLVYHGPAAGLKPEEWTLKTPEELLALKVCDMAMGSGAFLVQACRYLGSRLVEAWEGALSPQLSRTSNSPLPKGEGLGVRAELPTPRLTIYGESPTGALTEILIPDDENERQTLAMRLVADRCLYGVDKNPLAVEMAKLSLWLTTLAKGRPFTFLDHALKCGDSLVGVNQRQLSNWTLDTSEDEKYVPLLAMNIRTQIDEVIKLRQQIESFPVNTVDDQRVKTELLARADAHTHELRWAGDLLLATAFSEDSSAVREAMRTNLLSVVQQRRDVPEGYRAAVASVQAQRPFHWPLEFPEVFAKGGFDAFVGNPPFVGGQRITGTMGVPYRNYLIANIAGGVRGSADLVAYFFLRAYALLRDHGGFGLIATNTIAQGETREVGLDQITAQSGTIYAAVNDMPWPGAAAVNVNVVHVRQGGWKGLHQLDDRVVDGISSLLDIPSRASGKPQALAANGGKAFQGHIVLGMGFILPPDEAEELIQRDSRNREVLFPYLNGEDLNTHPEQKPSRWVVQFDERTEEEARTYPDVWQLIETRVKPERMTKDGTKYPRMVNEWWKFWNNRRELAAAIADLPRVLVVAYTSRTLGFSFVPNGYIYGVGSIPIATSNFGNFGVIQSGFHTNWVQLNSSTMKTDLRYTPSDCFETFPFPADKRSLETFGETYHSLRAEIMLAREEGLTATYNRFHDPDETSADIANLRALHVEMDNAVAAAYGWTDLDLGHGFHDTRQGTRYTLHPAARREVLDRLLELNHARHAEEARLGMHQGKKGKKKPSTPRPPSPSGRRGSDAAAGGGSAAGGAGAETAKRRKFDIRPYAPGGDADDAPPEQLDLFDDGEPKPKRLL